MVNRLYLVLRHKSKIRQKPPTERETIPEVVNRGLNARFIQEQLASQTTLNNYSDKDS